MPKYTYFSLDMHFVKPQGSDFFVLLVSFLHLLPCQVWQQDCSQQHHSQRLLAGEKHKHCSEKHFSYFKITFVPSGEEQLGSFLGHGGVHRDVQEQEQQLWHLHSSILSYCLDGHQPQ